MASPLTSRRFGSLWALCVVLCLVCASRLADASPPKTVVQHWGPEEVPFPWAFNMVQTDDGFIWLSTINGLVRFDGKDFEVFNQVNTPALTNNRIHYLQKDAQDNLWIGLDNEDLLKVTPRAFEEVTFEGRPFGNYRMLLPHQGNVTLLNSEGVFVTRDSGLHKLISFADLGAEQDTICCQADGAACIARTADYNFSMIDAEGIHALPMPEGSTVIGCAFDQHNRFWIRTKAGLFVWGGGRLVEVPIPNELFNDKTFELIPEKSGQFRLCTDSAQWVVEEHDDRPHIKRGAHRCIFESNIGENSFKVIDNRIHKNERPWAELSDTPITLLVTESEEVWASFQGQGMVRVSETRLTTHLPPAREQERVLLLWADSKGTVWSHHRGHALFKLNTARGGVLQPKDISAISGSLTVSMEDRQGRMWFGNVNGLNRQGDEGLTRFSLQPEPIDIRAILEDRRGRLWVGSVAGIWASPIDKITEDSWSLLGETHGLTDINVRALLETRDGRLLAATGSGKVFQKLEDTERFETIADFGERSATIIKTLFEDRSGTVWAGTEGRGLCWLETSEEGSEGRGISCLNTTAGMFDDTIHCVQEDASGRIWMSGNQGIAWLDRKEFEAVRAGERKAVTPMVYGTRDGMLDAECNGGRQKACDIDPRGHLWFATQKGVVEIDPEKMPRPPAPRPVLTRLKAGDRPEQRFPRPKDAVEVSLASEQDTVAFTWTAPVFDKPDLVRFRYKLRGYDRAWRGPTSERKATYLNLPPGELTFMVEAGLAGQWSKPTALARVNRQPTFTETAWFTLLLVVAGLVVVLVLVMVWTARLRRRKAELDDLVRQRTTQLSKRNEELDLQKRILAARSQELEDKNETLADQKDRLETQAERLEAQASRLAELDELKTRFIANVSHELRTPLTLVRGAVDDLLSSAPSQGAQRQTLEMAGRNAGRLGELVEQMLDIARLEAGAMPLKTRCVDLGAFLGRVTSRFEHLAAAKGLALRVEVGEAPVGVFIAPDAIDKVVTNLVGNAIKFTSEGAVTISMALEEDSVCVSVADTGIGIAPDDLERLFERFYQADRSDARAFEGTGLGLAIAREMVELHGGTLSARSTQGQGTTFTFTLPRGADHIDIEEIDLDQNAIEVSAPPSSTSEEAVADDEGRPVVMVVEDHPDMRAFIVSHLRPLYRVIQASDGQSALDTAAQHRPDAVVSDIMMPGLDGLEMTRRLKEDADLAHVPVMLVSAKGGEQTLKESLELADDFLPKPFRMAELKARLARLLDRPASKASTEAPQTPEEDGQPTEEDSDSGLSEADEALLARLESVVEARLADESLGVEALAREMAMSRTQLYRTLARLVGQPPKAYIRQVRLNQARRMLERGTFQTVGEVAAAVGMKRAFFSRSFKALFGASPTKHLKS